jgi:hypothetical protein
MTIIIDHTCVLTDNNCNRIKYDTVIEVCDDENFTMSLTGREAEVVVKAVNMGIDSRLQACYFPNNGDSYLPGERSIKATNSSKWLVGTKLVLTHTLECNITPNSLCILLRRLFEDMEDIGEDGDDADVGGRLLGSMTPGSSLDGKMIDESNRCLKNPGLQKPPNVPH